MTVSVLLLQRGWPAATLLVARADFERGGCMAELIALPVFDDELEPIAAGRQVFRHREAELDVEIASSAAAAIVDIGKFAAAHPLAFFVENFVSGAEKRAVTFFV